MASSRTLAFIAILMVSLSMCHAAAGGSSGSTPSAKNPSPPPPAVIIGADPTPSPPPSPPPSVVLSSPPPTVLYSPPPPAVTQCKTLADNGACTISNDASGKDRCCAGLYCKFTISTVSGRCSGCNDCVPGRYNSGAGCDGNYDWSCPYCKNCTAGQYNSGGACDGTLNSDRVCQTCPVNDKCDFFAEWDPVTNNDCKCALCKPGYKLVNGVCTDCSPCADDQKKVVNSDTLGSKSCDGFTDRVCETCGTLPTGCTAWDTWGLTNECKCKAPDANYYINGNRNAEACAACTTPGTKTTAGTCTGTTNRQCETCGNANCAAYADWAPNNECQCTKCDDGYFLDGGVCKACSGCADSKKKTGGCNGVIDTTCELCGETENPPTGCTAWDTWSLTNECKCKAPDANYYINGNRNAEACAACTTPGTKTTAGTCTGTTNRQCETCGNANCAAYADWAPNNECQCTKCDDGYFLDGGVCKACSGCADSKKKTGGCNGVIDTTCELCGETENPPTGCTAWDTWSLTNECKCASADTNYFLTASREAAACDSCDTGKKTKSGTCTGTKNRECLDCEDTNCKQFAPWTTVADACQCTECKSGHFLNVNGVCTPCSGCDNDEKKTGGCNGVDDTTCDACDWTGAGTCQNWADWSEVSECQCAGCESDAYVTGGTCATCKTCSLVEGKYQTDDCDGVNNTECADCSLGGTATHCKTWNASSECQCDECKSTYFLKTVGSDVTCAGCTSCSSGYYQIAACSVSADRQCKECEQADKCEIWENWSSSSPEACKCQKCKPGYQADANGVCQACTDTNCSTFSEQCVCSQCISKFEISATSNVCIKSDPCLDNKCGECEKCTAVGGVAVCSLVYGKTCSGGNGYCTTAGTCKTKVGSCTNFPGPGCNTMCGFEVKGDEVKEFHCKYSSGKTKLFPEGMAICGTTENCTKAGCNCNKPAPPPKPKGKRLLMALNQ